MVRIIIVVVFLIGVGCSTDSGSDESMGMQKSFAEDPHSFAKPNEAVITAAKFDFEVDFENRIIYGTATYDISHSGADEIVLDVNQLDILAVKLDDGERAKFRLGVKKPILGQSLVIPIKTETASISVEYRTRPGSAALQWLDPEQTGDKEMPFLFTQGQAILTRTWIPIQDSPGIRFPYSATVKVPQGMLALMSASNPRETNDSGEYTFKMSQPIPAYLIALAVGKLEFKAVGDRAGVYAEPSMVHAAAWEFAEMQDMLHVTEELYGPYDWERYDVLVLPPSFPFGGMENPRLTFATPTIIAGDRSLVALIAHELAHSWSGNLVTNATWNDFWLNEGFTVYLERRIMEAMEGKSYAKMLAQLGYQDLEEDIRDLGEASKDTHLKLDLAGRNPDDGMNDVAYEKGYFFLRILEEKAGRETFDTFLRKYFDDHRFQSVDTESFIAYLKRNLIEPNDLEVNLDAWIYGPGIPSETPEVRSKRFEKVDTAVSKIISDVKADIDSSYWTPHEWLHFVRQLPDNMPVADMETLDDRFGFTSSGNSEIKAIWFVKSVETGYYEKNAQDVEEFLVEVGRRKFLTPLYRAMVESDMMSEARRIYARARPNYHSVSRGTMDQLLEYQEM